MVEISLSGSGEGPGRATGRGYSTLTRVDTPYERPAGATGRWPLLL
jgi:hypothetical protein